MLRAKMEESLKPQLHCDYDALKSEINAVCNSIDKEDTVELYKRAKNVHEALLSTKFYDLISAVLSLIGLLKYKSDAAAYKESLSILEDGRFLAENSGSKYARKLNYFCRGVVCMMDKNYYEAVVNLTVAKSVPVCEISLDNKIENLLNHADFYSNTETHYSVTTQKPLVALLNVARTLAVETNLDMLLKTMAQEVKKVLNADRCSVFLLDKQKNELWSKIALGVESQEIRFAADKGLAGYVVKTGEVVNITDAYEDPRFNPEVDNDTGYKTCTILCMPIRNMKHEILGVFQVLNKLSGTFTQEDEELLVAIGTSAGIAIENSRLFDAQQKMINTQKELFKNFIDTLAASIDARDKITAGHSSRVKMYSELICDVMGIDGSQRNKITYGAILHDIGKIGIRDAVLQKEGKLTDEEYKHIQEHVKITYDILNKVYLSDDFKEVAEIASSHHEKYDGSGYFRKLAGEDICLGGRILAVSDVFDAITSKRHYRDKMPIKDALNIIKTGSGKHFDPKIVDAFFSVRLDNLVRVFLSEVDWVLEYNDGVELSHYTVDNLYNLLVSVEIENFNDEQKHFFEIFNHYYNCKAGN